MAANTAPVLRTTAFRVSCWVLGVLAFAEVMSAAVALAGRFEATRPVRVVEVIKEVKVPQIITVPAPAAVADAGRLRSRGNADIVARPPQAEPPVAAAPAAPAPNPLGAPKIADPVVERLVLEARKFRVAGDMEKTITKLNEAAVITPDEPNVEYELGLVHEDMEIFDKASAHYERVFRMGATKGGALYELAAGKLRDGFEDPKAMRGKLSLGRTRIYRDVNYAEGERVVLTVPVQAAPGTNVGPDDFFVTVRFFDTLRGKEIVSTSEETSIRDSQWVSGSIDWAGGEELLRVTYVIPPQSAADERLFGARTYYGQSVELNYKNELIDVQAWPRDLAARTQQPQQQTPKTDGAPLSGDVPPEFLDKDTLPPGFNPGAPLLPALPKR